VNERLTIAARILANKLINAAGQPNPIPLVKQSLMYADELLKQNAEFEHTFLGNCGLEYPVETNEERELRQKGYLIGLLASNSRLLTPIADHKFEDCKFKNDWKPNLLSPLQKSDKPTNG
jgi:hypothetical protein